MPDSATAIRKAFGDTLGAERRARRLTQEMLAEKADMSLNYIGTMERGEQMPSLEFVVRVAAAMRMTAGELLTKAKL